MRPVPHPFAAPHAVATAAPWLAPSLLAADAARLGDEALAVQRAGADWLHVDVMDGHFVPNLAFSPHVVKAVRRACTLPLDVHLMLARPQALLEAFAEAGADMLTFHVEAEGDVTETLAQVRALGRRAGLSVRPHTPLQQLLPYLGAVDLVLVMGVVPGFGGQAMLDGTLERLRVLCDARRAGGHAFTLQLDGGVHGGNAGAAHAAGADALVAGSAIYAAARPGDGEELQEATATHKADVPAGPCGDDAVTRRYADKLQQLRRAASTAKG